MISSASFHNGDNKFNFSLFSSFKAIRAFWKMVSLPVVLLIFISSNDPMGKLKEGIAETSTMEPERGFVDNANNAKSQGPQVNDLTAVDFKFPDDHLKEATWENKKFILEKTIRHEKNEGNKTPVPLYSLVKNDCGEGYALDENGVCQKTIAVRSGKTLDSDRRRKRQVSDYDWLLQKQRLPIAEQPLPYRKASHTFLIDGSRRLPVECSKLYPGLVPDGVGGCVKLGDVPNSTF